MNFLALAQRVKRESGRTGVAPLSIASSNTSDRQLFDWVADAWAQIQTETREWHWMRRQLDAVLTPTVGSYAGTDLFAADFGRWRRPSKDYTVRVYTPTDPSALWRLTYLEPDVFRSRFDDAVVTDGSPQFWTVDNGQRLRLGPRPDLAYRVKADFVIEPTALSVETDEPNMPERFHVMLVWRAVAEVAMFDAAAELLARARANYDTWAHQLVFDQTDPIGWHATPLA